MEPIGVDISLYVVDLGVGALSAITPHALVPESEDQGLIGFGEDLDRYSRSTCVSRPCQGVAGAASQSADRLLLRGRRGREGLFEEEEARRLVQRRPGEHHRAAYARIWSFLKACGPPAEVSVAGCGRKKFQLDARTRGMVQALDGLGLNPSSLYHQAACGASVPEDNTACDELRPYRPLDADRIRPTGTGGWDCRPSIHAPC